MEDDHTSGKLQAERRANLLDCYRIALDFGLPAAERAFALMDEGEPHQPKTEPKPESAMTD